MINESQINWLYVIPDSGSCYFIAPRVWMVTEQLGRNGDRRPAAMGISPTAQETPNKSSISRSKIN